jgi:hypothetical protein
MSKIETHAGSYAGEMPSSALRKKVSAKATTARESLAERPLRRLLPSLPGEKRSALPTALAVLALLAGAGCGGAEGSPTIRADGEGPERVVAVVKSGTSDPTAPGSDPSSGSPEPLPTSVMISGSVSAVAAPVPTPHPRHAGVRPPVHPRPPPPAGGPRPVSGATSAGCPTPSPPTY